MQFLVSDTGTGIPEHELDRIFEKFHRIHDQQGRSNEGSGIGLALTQELVKLHGGTIEVESQLGKGTTFTILIPVGKAHLSPEHILSSSCDSGFRMTEAFTTQSYGKSVIEEASFWLPSSPSDLSSGKETNSLVCTDSQFSLRTTQDNSAAHSSNQWQVLVVDDNKDMRSYVKSVLHPFYDVIEASSGGDALSKAVLRKPDLIISDIMMPGLDGYGNRPFENISNVQAFLKQLDLFGKQNQFPSSS